MNHVSTLRLHQLRLGELAPEEEGQLRAHLADCEACASRLNAQMIARQEFQRQPVPDWAQPKPPWWQRLRWLVLVPLTAGALLLVQPPSVPPETVSPEKTPLSADLSPDTRLKGDLPSLEIWVQTGQSARPLYNGEHLGEGSKVQLQFHPSGHRFVTLAGKDSSGTVEVYGTLQPKTTGLQPAPFSLTLDASKGQQMFYAILTDIRPDPRAVKEAVGGDQNLLSGAQWFTASVEKE